MLAARAAGHAGAPRAFAELASIAPEGLIPTPGRGAVHVARQIERAANVVTGAASLLGDEIVDAFEWAAGMTRRIASTADGLDPAGAARAARRGVATIRGLVAGTIDRDERWEAFRLGTHLPRAAWVTALVGAAGTISRERGDSGAWRVAGAVTGLDPESGEIAARLLTDRTVVASVAYALAEAEGAVLALHRERLVAPAALPFARDAQSRLRETAAALPDEAALSTGADRLLDAIGALAGAIDPSVAEPGPPPPPGLRRPLQTAGSPTMA